MGFCWGLFWAFWAYLAKMKSYSWLENPAEIFSRPGLNVSFYWNSPHVAANFISRGFVSKARLKFSRELSAFSHVCLNYWFVLYVWYFSLPGAKIFTCGKLWHIYCAQIQLFCYSTRYLFCQTVSGIVIWPSWQTVYSINFTYSCLGFYKSDSLENSA